MWNLAVILLCVLLCSPCLACCGVGVYKRCSREIKNRRSKVDIDEGEPRQEIDEREEKHDILLKKKTLRNMLEGRADIFEDEENDIVGNNTTYFEHSSKFISAE